MTRDEEIAVLRSYAGNLSEPAFDKIASRMEANSASINSHLKELMPGLEFPPTVVTMLPGKLFAIGQAIARHAMMVESLSVARK